MVVFAQIAPVKTYDKPYELIGHIGYLDKKTRTYYLYLRSSNQFEDYVVRYKIGKTGKEASMSLANLHAALKNKGQMFNVGRYKFIVSDSKHLSLIKNNDLYYKAGDYNIYDWEMTYTVRRLIIDHGAACGNVLLIAGDLEIGKLDLISTEYNMKFPIDLHRDLTPLLSRAYDFGSLLSQEDVLAMLHAASDGKIDCPLLKAFYNE